MVNLDMCGDELTGNTAGPLGGEVISLPPKNGGAIQDPIREDLTIILLDNVLVKFSWWAILIPEVIEQFDTILRSADGYNTAQQKVTRDHCLSSD